MRWYARRHERAQRVFGAGNLGRCDDALLYDGAELLRQRFHRVIVVSPAHKRPLEVAQFAVAGHAGVGEVVGAHRLHDLLSVIFVKGDEGIGLHGDAVDDDAIEVEEARRSHNRPRREKSATRLSRASRSWSARLSLA